MVDTNFKTAGKDDEQNQNSHADQESALKKIGELHKAGVLHRLGEVAGLGALYKGDQHRKLAEFLGGEAIHHADEHKFGALLAAGGIHKLELAKVGELCILKKLAENSGKIACALKTIGAILGLGLILSLLDRTHKHGLGAGLFAGSIFEKTKALGIGLAAEAIKEHHRKEG